MSGIFNSANKTTQEDRVKLVVKMLGCDPNNFDDEIKEMSEQLLNEVERRADSDLLYKTYKLSVYGKMK